MTDPERNRLSARVARAAKVGATLSGAAAAYGRARLFGGEEADKRIAAAVRAALGQTKGPLMKVAQMLATVPDFLPPEYAEELSTLQAHAPSMGPSFVERRMRVELGPEWRSRFREFEPKAAAAASLGQVHRAVGVDGHDLACKLQYPEMASAVESDLVQLNAILALVKSMNRIIDPSEIGAEIAERLREELDYEREAKAVALYNRMLADMADVRVPQALPELSSKRLLTMTWLSGQPLSRFESAPQETRNHIARLLFHAWWDPMHHYGVIHGDPHLGNYSFSEDGRTLNLLDFGCIRIFPAEFVAGVLKLREALMRDDREACVQAYRDWGFGGDLKPELVDALNVWARFIYGPIMDDRVRSVADGVKPGQYGRREAFSVKQMLVEHGPVIIPREFVFMDRAAIGLGSAFLRLGAELNFFRLFEESIAEFSTAKVECRQREALQAVHLEPGAAAAAIAS